MHGNEKLGLRPGDFEAQMKPCGFRDIHRAGEAGAIVDLPVAAGMENRSVLHCVGKAGLVLAEIDFLVVGLVAIDANVESEEATVGGSGNVHVDNGVTHFKILQEGGAAVE